MLPCHKASIDRRAVNTAAGWRGRRQVSDPVDSAAFAEMNLRMLVLAGGRERTIDDYSALAADAGLQVTVVHDITERHVIIECVPI